MQEARVAELQKAVLHAEDAAMETEREFHDFRLNHDALLEHCAHVLTVFASTATTVTCIPAPAQVQRTGCRGLWMRRSITVNLGGQQPSVCRSCLSDWPSLRRKRS